jgi:nucleotide-binding universal stress UspA family protein
MAQLQKILVAVDFSTPCDAVVDEALLLAKRFGATLDLMHVWRMRESEEDPPAPLESFVTSVPGHRMAEYLDRAEELGVNASGRLERGDPEAIILARASEGYDLLVLGTRGRGALAHMVRPSVAEHVVRKAPCPVLTVHSS